MSALSDFFQRRVDWLQIAIVPRLRGGAGYDIVLRLDGTYCGPPRGLDDNARYLALKLEEALGAAGISTSARGILVPFVRGEGP